MYEILHVDFGTSSPAKLNGFLKKPPGRGGGGAVIPLHISLKQAPVDVKSSSICSLSKIHPNWGEDFPYVGIFSMKVLIYILLGRQL